MTIPTYQTIVREILNSKLYALLKNISPGDVLEVGAGKFNNYKSMIPHKLYVTMDVNSKRYPNIVSDIQLCSVADNSFDVVLMIEVLEHCPNPQKAVNELHRICRSQGVCIVSTRFMQPLHEEPNDYYRFTQYSLQVLFKQFQQVNIYPMGNWITNIYNLLYWNIPLPCKSTLTRIVKKLCQKDGGNSPLGYIVVAKKYNKRKEKPDSEIVEKSCLSEMLSKQIFWLQTWKTKEGAYNGYVVHRYDLKRMCKIHDTPWSQGPIITGYLNLYQKTSDKKWLQEAIQAADLQCRRLHKTGKYIYAGFEDDRFSSLVHNSLANCALLDLAKILIDEGNEEKAEKYLKIVKENINKYIIGVLWDEDFGAFKFSETDYYTPDVIRFVVNMNSVAVESLIKLSYLTGEQKYQDYAIRVGEWMLTEQIISSNLENGGINYSQVQPGYLISIYTALAMRGLNDLYYLTKDLRYLEMMRNAANHSINLIDPETNLFFHAVINGEIVKYPQFIAGAGIILKALDDAEKLTGEKFDYQDTLGAILKRQILNGGFSNFMGYRNKNGNGYGVWEDKVPVIGWNAHIFEFLTRMVQKDFSYKPAKFKINCLATKNYFYRESKRSVLILGIKPIRSLILYFVVKKTNYALLYVSVNQLEKLLVRVLPTRIKNIIKRVIGA